MHNNIHLKLYWVLLITITCFGCADQYKLDYDRKQKSFKTCSKEIGIEELSIWDSNGFNMVYEIHLNDNAKACSEIFLFKENPGYQTVDQQLKISDSNKFHFIPNTKYKVVSTHYESSVEIILHTNKNAEVDYVINEYNCK